MKYLIHFNALQMLWIQMYKCTLCIFLIHSIICIFHLGADKPITFQMDNVYENVSKIIKIYDCKYRLNRYDSNVWGSNVKHLVQTAEVTECSLFSLIDSDHILQLKHDDHIKTLTHSLQKYNISINSNDIVLLVFVH